MLYVDYSKQLFYNDNQGISFGRVQKGVNMTDDEKELIELLSSCKEEEKQSIAEMIHAILENYE